MISKKGYELKNLDTGKRVFIPCSIVETHVSRFLLELVDHTDLGTDCSTPQH